MHVSETLPAKRITKAQARKATDHIKEAAGEVCRLLTAAHDLKLWKILDYESFGAYAETEFDMTSGNAYKIVTQGHVVAALEEASQSALPPGAISAREAGGLKRELEEISEALRVATEGKDEAARLIAAQEELSRLREQRAMAAAGARKRKDDEDEKSRARDSEEAEEQVRRAEAERLAREAAATEAAPVAEGPAPEPPSPPPPDPPDEPEELTLTAADALAFLLTSDVSELGSSLKQISALKAKVDGLYKQAGGETRVSAELAWQALKLFDTKRLVDRGYTELKSMQRKIAEALKYTPMPSPSGNGANPKRSPASTDSREVESFFKKGGK